LALPLVLFAPPASLAADRNLTTPSGITLTLESDQPSVRAAPTGFTIELRAELTNDGEAAQSVLVALGAERADLSVEHSGARQVCKHHFLWWNWDCFTYCNLPSDPQYLTPLCEDDPPLCCPSTYRIIPNIGVPTPDPLEAGAGEGVPPADIVFGVVASGDPEKIATALNRDPVMANPDEVLDPGETWHLTLRVPVVIASDVQVPTFAVSVADDTGFVVRNLPVQIAEPCDQCLGDGDGDRRVTIAELILAVNHSLNGCPTPRPTIGSPAQ